MTVSVRLVQFSDAALGDGGIQYSQPRKTPRKIREVVIEGPAKGG